MQVGLKRNMLSFIAPRSLLYSRARSTSLFQRCHLSKRENSSSVNKKNSTLDQEELEKFSKLSSNWWDERGTFASLQTMNELRVPLIRDALYNQHIEDTKLTSVKPLTGVTILDVGCGGGILTEPLARLGATVTGVDASEENIEAARMHTSLDPGILDNINYKCTLVEDLVGSGDLYDGVVASEIVEHVSDVDMFISSCCQLVKPNGSLFITTINRTQLSYGLAVIAAERLLNLVPVGAHDWNKFITPQELQQILCNNGMVTRLLHGMLLNPLTLRWTWTKDTPMNYALHAVKSDKGILYS